MLRIVPLNEAKGFVTRKAVRLSEAEAVVAPILEAVRSRGDEAVLEYARKFDGLEGEFDCFHLEAPGFLLNSSRRIETAAKNVREYAELQLPRDTWTEFPDGRRLGSMSASVGIDGRIHSGRPLSAAIHIVDDRDSRAGGGCPDDLRYVAASEHGDPGGGQVPRN